MKDAWSAYREVQHHRSSTVCMPCLCAVEAEPACCASVMGNPKPQGSWEAVVGIWLHSHPMVLVVGLDYLEPSISNQTTPWFYNLAHTENYFSSCLHTAGRKMPCEHLSSSSRAVPCRERGHRLCLRSCHRSLVASLTPAIVMDYIRIPK